MTPTATDGCDSTNTFSNSSRSNALLIGNTKTIWPTFLEWLQKKVAVLKVEVEKTGGDFGAYEENLNLFLENDPFDSFCKETVTEIVLEHCTKSQDQVSSFEIFLTTDTNCFRIDESGNEVLGEKFLVAAQRVATVSGAFWYDNVGTMLSVHPEYGPWHSFRAVVVFGVSDGDDDGNKDTLEEDEILIPPVPSPLPRPVPQEEIDGAKQVLDLALRLCSSCDVINECKNDTKLEKYLCSENDHNVSQKITPTNKAFIDLRDCISLGKEEYRYGNEQMFYHYCKDAIILRRELERLATTN